MEALADLVLRLAERGCEDSSRYRRIDVATLSEEQLGRPGSAGLPSVSSLIFWRRHNCVHRVFSMAMLAFSGSLKRVSCLAYCDIKLELVEMKQMNSTNTMIKVLSTNITRRRIFFGVARHAKTLVE